MSLFVLLEHHQYHKYIIVIILESTGTWLLPKIVVFITILQYIDQETRVKNNYAFTSKHKSKIHSGNTIYSY